MKKTTTKAPIIRCRVCYAELHKPTCDRCLDTRIKMHEIAGAAHYIFGIRATIFERGIFGPQKGAEKSKV